MINTQGYRLVYFKAKFDKYTSFRAKFGKNKAIGLCILRAKLDQI